ncbi:tyrosine-protein kinase SRK2-like [Apostichopus japonicus]|uniref:tyrosine-protein kinase SRK2-like n=1 Tax=Stichopus japonicus TaxID=307972 RepID=UPI003AB4A9B4
MGCFGSKTNENGERRSPTMSNIRGPDPPVRHESRDTHHPADSDQTRGVSRDHQIDHTYLGEPKPLPLESWYFGKIDIDRCNKLLADPQIPEGTFLVRESTTKPDTFTLSVKHYTRRREVEVISFRIFRRTNQSGEVYLDSSIDNRQFPSMRALVQHYKENDVRSEEMIITLREGIKNQTHQHDIIFDIKPEEITETSQSLGTGNFGQVVKGTWYRPQREPMAVALKKLKQYTASQNAEFEKEFNMLKMVYHDNIVTFFGVCVKMERTVIVTEFMTKGELRQHLEKNPTITEDTLYYYALKIASGMVFLESKNIIHRDLAARNVLLGDQHLVKIADFGLSRLMDPEDCLYPQTTEVQLPVKWTAPEGLCPVNRQFSSKSDVWSYGILLTEIINEGKQPYLGVPMSYITWERLYQHGFRMTKEELGPRCNDSLFGIMTDCWKTSPQDRPDFKMIYQRIYTLYQPFAPLT